MNSKIIINWKTGTETELMYMFLYRIVTRSGIDKIIRFTDSFYIKCYHHNATVSNSSNEHIMHSILACYQ